MTYAWAPSGGTAATATNLSAGTYTVTITDANNCTKTQSVVITQPTAITSSVSSQTNVTCNEASTGAATISASGGTGTLTYAWAPSGGTAATATNLSAGTYTVTITDANNCTKTQSVVITQPTAIAVTATPFQAACNGGNGTATLSATGGNSSYTFTSSGGTVTGSSLSAPAGTYTIIATDGNSCTGTTTVTITEPTALAVTATPTAPDCNGGSGTAILSATGGIRPYTFTSSGGTVTGSSLSAPAGTYTITATDGNSCTGTTTVTITEPAAVAVTATPSPADCNGGNGSAALSATGGDASYTFTSSGGTVTGSSLSAPAGTYTITATDGNNCTGTTTVTITEPDAIVASATPTAALCNGANGTAALSATGGDASYTFTSSGGTVTGSSLSAPAGTYTITATDGNNCTGTTTVTITEPEAVAVTATPSPAACNGANGTAALSATGGDASYTFTSSGGTVTGSSLSAPAGTYTITATDGNSCTGTTTVTITEPAAVAVTATPFQAACNGGNGTATLSATGGNSSYTFTSSGGTITGSSLSAPAGTYTITATDGNSCTGTTTVTITEPAAVVVTATPSPADCNGANGTAALSATGGDASYTFTSSGGTVTGSSLSAPAGTYTITATDGNSCTGTTTVTITEPAAVAVTATPFQAACNGGNGTATLSATGGNSSYTFTSSGGTITGSSLSAPAGTYTITATDGNSCTGTTTVTITEPAAVVVTATPSPADCNGGNGTAALSATGGDASYTFTSSGGTVTGSSLSAPAGTYTITATDGNSCTGTTTVTITEPAAVVVTATPSPAACNGGNGSAALSATGGDASYTFTSTGGTVTGSSLSAPAGTYTITATDGNSCTGTTTVTITEPDAIVASATPTAALCNGANGTAALSATGGDASYTFTSSGGTVTGSSLSAPAGTYTITATDGNSCTGTTTVTITEPAAVAVTATPSPADCNGVNGSAALSATGGDASYTFTSTGGTVTGSSLSAPAGTYTITATDGNSCTGTTTVTITEPAAALSASAADYTLGCTETTGNIILTVEGGTSGYSYDWDNDGTGDFDDAKDLLNVPTGTYNVTVRDANGCETTASGEVIFTPCPSLTIEKSQVAGQNPVSTPGAIDYEIEVVNTGNIDLTGVTVSDTLPNGSIGLLTGPTESLSNNGVLEIGENFKYTITYNVSQGDIDDGLMLVNEAVVTTTELPEPKSDTAKTPVSGTKSLSIVKTQVSGQNPVTSPGFIGYEIVVSNDGNQSLTNVSVSDTLPDGSIGVLSSVSESGTVNDTLEVSETFTYTISYAVTQADIDAGAELINNAVVTTTELPTPKSDTARTPTSQTPSLTIVKTQVGGETTVTKPGNIDYEVVVTNTGNISLTNVVVSDTLPNGTVGTLSTVSESINTNNVLDTTETWTYTISYAVTQADIDAGAELVNNAVVTTTELPTPKSDTARTPTSQTPSLTIVKTQVGGETTVTKPGNIDYEVVVTNTGNISLTNVVVSDTLPNGAVGTLSTVSESINTNNVLDTTETWTYTISYAVTQADIDAGAELVNNAVVTTTELPTPKSDTARTPTSQTPSLTIVKTQVGGETTVTKPGNIDYEVVVTNTGNISLTNVVVSDTLPNGTVGTLSTVAESINTNNVLDTTETWTYTISYAVTQADIDAGAELINNAVVTTTELPTPKSDTARTPTSQTPSLTIVKTQVGGETTVTKPGNIDYEVVVTNTGNISLTNVVVSDTLPNGTVGTLSTVSESINTNNILDTTETWTYTISYAVTQADIDAGAELINNAVVTTTELPTPKSDTARTPTSQTPSLTIVKTQVGGENPVTKPGDIDYTIVVTNTGNVSLTNVVVSDTLPNGAVGILPGATESINTNNILDTTETWTYTISYAVTQADIDAGAELINNAVVTTTELPTPKSDTARTPTSQTPSLTIVKTQVGGETTLTKPGNIDYEVVVTNTGNISLTNVVVSDTLPNGTVGTLSTVSESINTNNILDTTETWTYTISYAVTQADIDAGAELINNAVVTTTELPTPKSDTARTPTSQTPSLTIVKTQVGGETTVTKPGNIDYEVVVTNTGNISLTNVVVSDTLPNGAVGTLSTVSESINTNNVLDTTETWTYTISYAVTQADIDAGAELINNAVVTTTELPTPKSDTARTPTSQTPSLTIVKTQVGGETTVTKPGNIDYEVVVTNTGNISLTNVVVSDTLPNGTVGTLSTVAESINTNNILDTTETWTYTISYAVTQADIDAGSELVNNAVVTTTELPTPKSDTARTPTSQTPSLTIVKTQVGGETTVTKPGDIDYTIVVTNTGNVSLTNVVVSDTLPNGAVGILPGATESINSNNILDTTETWTYTISYAVTQADIDAGSELVNNAVVTTTELPTPKSDTARTPTSQTPSLTIVKTQVGGETTVTKPGDIDYTIVVTNTGNVSLTNVVVSDTLPNGAVGILPGATESINSNNILDTTETWTYTISYAVTQADIDAGAELINNAVVTTTELPTPKADTARTPTSQTPSLTIVKTQVGGETTVTKPGNIDYEVVVTNTGNISLTNVVVSDTLPNGTVGTLSTVSESINTNNILDTTETWTYTISYAVTQADIDAGAELINNAVVTTDELPTPKSDTARTPTSQTPSLTIVKTQVGGENPVTKPGDIDYTIVVTNTGNVSLTNVVVSDTLPNGAVGILPGATESINSNNILDTTETWTYTISYAVTQADIDAGAELINNTVVTTEELPTPKSDTARTPTSQTPSLTIVKTQVGGETTVTKPGNIDYEVVVTNTGNISLTNVVVSDTLPNGTVGTLSTVSESINTNNVLDTTETWTYMISYAVTQADIDAGAELINNAVVTTTELPTPKSDTARTPTSQTPSLTIVKTQVGGENPVTKPGDIDYTIVVTNTGNVSLTNVVVSDTLPNGAVGILPGATESINSNNILDTTETWTYTISYAVTQADIDAGAELINNAVVTTTELPTPKSDTARTPTSQTPSLTIVKTQVGGETTVRKPGNIDYEVVVTNTGNISLTNVVVSDTLPNGTVGTLSTVSESINTNNILDTTETWTYTISYAVTQADIDAGAELINNAVVTTTELPTPKADTARTPTSQTPWVFVQLLASLIVTV
ncbi:beta strand repeat-containing protein [Arcticibacterium luteifluviistationis]|uniref:PKD/Chitinase domain-containing protein n=1 Tax=Arcticibacterium luteifluviistationis TaxID=1784714 RepID=A0A2Z4GGD4_9BACT|nr:DUF11 domain-containing protein [Arcticibacterium luteifluviistationis]AWW00242.1 hypothetical protein DJ013_19520 [Arcticibacterium luteifluviistationis]